MQYEFCWLPGQKTGGAGGIRTHVQTYSSKAFYMLILELIVGKRQEPNEPTASVAE